MGTFQFKPLQGGHLSKANKSFCPVSVRFREVPLYLISGCDALRGIWMLKCCLTFPYLQSANSLLTLFLASVETTKHGLGYPVYTIHMISKELHVGFHFFLLLYFYLFHFMFLLTNVSYFSFVSSSFWFSCFNYQENTGEYWNAVQCSLRNFTWFNCVGSCGSAYFSQSFAQIAQSYAKNVHFHKNSTPGNQVKLRYVVIAPLKSLFQKQRCNNTGKHMKWRGKRLRDISLISAINNQKFRYPFKDQYPFKFYE